MAEDKDPIFSFRSHICQLTSKEIKLLIEYGPKVFQLLMRGQVKEAKAFLDEDFPVKIKLKEVFRKWVVPKK